MAGRKSAARRPPSRASAASKRKSAARKTAARGTGVHTKPVLLSGGNPQIAKAEGDAPVRAYLAALSGWKRDIARRLDQLVVRNVPNVHKAVKWNSPFYGIQGRGWFLAFHLYSRAIKVTFFRGTSLLPPPPGGIQKEPRWIDVHEDDLDEARMTKWIRQAAAIPGWDPSAPKGPA